MQHRRPDASSNARTQLPPLAPRGQQSVPATSANADTESAGGSTSSTRPRLSHRSRAGCWTCRKRKVKCDEVHPRCGPCTRLNKECDWEFRWKFDDVTQNTRHKYSNVSTAGNAVWDPQAPRLDRSSLGNRRSQSPTHDNLPSFSELTNDEDRERKAEFQVPGTFNVVVNPESFASLPEYGPLPGARSRRASIHSGRNSWDSQMSTEALRHRPKINFPSGDPNIVVLAKFEDAPLSLPSLASFPVDRRTSLPENLHSLSISGGLRGSSLPSGRRNDSVTQGLRDERLMVHYRGFISKRIFPIGKTLLVDRPSQEDPIVAEARDFPPLYHAICAVSLLSLALKGQQQLLTEAFQHYHQAISSSLSSPSDLHSDRLLYLHFLLLIYDISYATQGSSNTQEVFNMSMWEHHIQHLIRIAQHRKGQSNGILQAYLLWYVLYLDKQACLSGNGNGDFVRAFLTNDLTMPDWNRIFGGFDIVQPGDGYRGEDTSAHTDVFTFAHHMCIQGAKLCQLSLKIRAEAAVQDLNGPQGSQILAARIQLVAQYQSELYATWNRYCPSYLFQPNSEYATGRLPAIARIFLDFAQLQFSTWVIYSSSSLYPTQSFHLTPSQRSETRLHSLKILSMADAAVTLQNYDHHQLVFPIFVAGFASPDMETKARAIASMRVMEGTGISRNATRSRELLGMVYDEQRERILAGGRPEEVDWIDMAKAKGMGVVNFGL
ncbi:hypothetical protein E4T42_04273 [Aureobasidium subglaciale]|nr:hypothetical protein E4T42_04273 [Aureobasidium subglaciale]